MKKPFSESEVGDEIFFIDPQTQSIMTTQVVKSLIHPKSRNKKTWYIEFNRIMKHNVAKADDMDNAREKGTANTTMKALLPVGASMVTLPMVPPLVICTTRKELLTWMEKDRAPVKSMIDRFTKDQQESSKKKR